MRSWGVFLTLLLLLPSASSGREWSDVDGKHKTQAELVAVADEKAILRLPSERLIEIPLLRLSERDQAFVAGYVANRDKVPSDSGASAAEPQPRATGSVATIADSITANVLTKFAMQPGEPGRRPAPRDNEVIEPGTQDPGPVDDRRRNGSSGGMNGSGGMIGGGGMNGGGGEEATGHVGIHGHDFAELCHSCCADGICEKYVYSSYRGTFHLVGEIGTALYYFRDDPYGPSEQHLATLVRTIGCDHRFLLYKPCGGDSYVVKWAFDRIPSYSGHYAVWYGKPDGTWSFYTWARRLPRGDLWP